MIQLTCLGGRTETMGEHPFGLKETQRNQLDSLTMSMYYGTISLIWSHRDANSSETLREAGEEILQLSHCWWCMAASLGQSRGSCGIHARSLALEHSPSSQPAATVIVAMSRLLCTSETPLCMPGLLCSPCLSFNVITITHPQSFHGDPLSCWSQLL